jgi:hypothetical protein
MGCAMGFTPGKGKRERSRWYGTKWNFNPIEIWEIEWPVSAIHSWGEKNKTLHPLSIVPGLGIPWEGGSLPLAFTIPGQYLLYSWGDLGGTSQQPSILFFCARTQVCGMSTNGHTENTNWISMCLQVSWSSRDPFAPRTSWYYNNNSVHGLSLPSLTLSLPRFLFTPFLSLIYQCLVFIKHFQNFQPCAKEYTWGYHLWKIPHNCHLSST